MRRRREEQRRKRVDGYAASLKWRRSLDQIVALTDAALREFQGPAGLAVALRDRLEDARGTKCETSILLALLSLARASDQIQRERLADLQ